METEIRFCKVNGKKAIFHRWFEASYIVPPSPMVGGHGGGVVIDLFALVEYEDGSIGRVPANENIKFETYPNSIASIDFEFFGKRASLANEGNRYEL